MKTISIGAFLNEHEVNVLATAVLAIKALDVKSNILNFLFIIIDPTCYMYIYIISI